MTLAPAPPAVAEIKLTGIFGTNSPYPYPRHALPFVGLKIISSNSHFIPQWSSNAVDWITPAPTEPYFGDYNRDFIESSGWSEFILRYNPFMCFYRAIEDKFTCKSGLRKIARLKENAAFTNNWSGDDLPTDTDLFFAYTNKPACPASGTYSLGIMSRLPICTVEPHNNP
jgi:hypothetical protein